MKPRGNSYRMETTMERTSLEVFQLPSASGRSTTKKGDNVTPTIQ